MKMLGANTLQNRCGVLIWKVPFHVCVIFSEKKWSCSQVIWNRWQFYLYNTFPGLSLFNLKWTMKDLWISQTMMSQ
jgi:hypothetical protein